MSDCLIKSYSTLSIQCLVLGVLIDNAFLQFDSLFFSSDTTALSIAWALHYLSINPGVQARLKEELATVPVYTPSQVCGQDEIMAHFDAIDHLPYLDAVMKETIRLSPSIHSTIRVATTDDEIPLSEEMVMRDGTVEKTFKVKKGQWIHLPLEATSVDRTIWGEDAWEFMQVLVLFQSVTRC